MRLRLGLSLSDDDAPAAGGGGGGALFGPDPFENLNAWTLQEQSADSSDIVAGAWGLQGGGTLWATIWNGTALPDAGTKWYAQAAITNAANASSFAKFALLFNASDVGEVETGGTPHGYVAYYRHSATPYVRLRRRAGGGPETIFETGQVSFAANDVLRIEVTDNGTSVAFEFFKNGESIGTYTDETPPSSRAAIWGIGVQSVSSANARVSVPEMGTV